MNMYQVDEALINANAALANTNNPDDQVKIENLYNSFKKGKISKSEFDKGINYYIQPSPKFNDKVNEKIANDITEGSKVWGDPEKLALRAASARQALRADRQHRLNERYYTDVYGSKLFHDAMKGNIVTGDPAALELRAAAARQFFINDQKNKLAGRYFADALGARAFHDAMDGNIVTPKAQAEAEKKAEAEAEAKAKAEAAAKAKADADAKAAAGKNNKPGKKPRMSDDEIDAFLKEELGGNTTGGTYASPGVPKGGTKTIGYDSEQERRAALIDEWNKEHGISYVTGKDGVIYRIDPQHPKGYADPFKNDLSTWTRATYASPGISTGGTYATGEGIKDANGNVLTNPGGDWEYQYALRDPQYGLGMMGKMSDAQKEYLQAVSDDMGYKYNFKGANRFV